MADPLYLQVLKALETDPASGGVEDPSQYGFPSIGPNPLQDFSVPPDYLKAMAQQQQPQRPAPSFQMAQPRRKIGLLQRPQQFVSELLLGGDPMGALMEGRATTETLGRALFSGAQEKGFQAADLPAFAVDVLSDPLTFILPPLIGRSFKAIGSLFGKTTSVKFFADTISDVMARTGPKARGAALRRMFKPPGVDGGIGMTNEWFKEIAIKAGTQKAGQAVKLVKDYTPGELETLLSYMGNIEYQMFQPSSGLFGQALNRAGLHLAPIVSVLKNQGGVWGQKLAGGIEGVMQGTLENYGRVANDYLKYVDDIGLAGAKAAPIRAASMLLAEAGGKGAAMDDILRVVEQHGDVADDVIKALINPESFEQAGKLATRNREVMDLYSGILGGFKDAGGKGFTIATEGAPIPFAEGVLSNYMPHMFDWNELKVGTAGYTEFVRKFMKQKGIKSYAQAESMIETLYRKTPKKFGNIEHARVMELGGYKLDPLEFLPQWLYKTEYRLNFAKQFGVNGDGAKTLANAIKKGSGLDAKWVDDISSILLDRHPNQYGVNQIIQKMTGFQVLTKMGFGSSIANASQSINTMAVFGIGNFMKGVAGAFTDEGAKLGALAYNRETKKAIEEMIGGAGGSGWAARYLGAVGFNWVEKWNRFFAANTGAASLRNWTAQLGRVGLDSPEGARIAGRLTRTLGATQDDLVRLASGEQPWREMLDRAALLASENTQHATHWHQLPKLWQIPEARLALQYKNFAYNQARFMHQQILMPAMEYLGSRGKAGDIAPLLRTVPLFTTAGQAVSHLRDLMRVPIRGIATGDWEAREKWLWEQEDEWFSNALRDSLTVGSFGMIGDAFTAAERGKLPAYLLGPTAGDVADLATRGIRLAKGTQDMGKSFDKFSTWMGRRTIPPALSMIPGTIGPIPIGPALAGVAQQYPYDVTYGDIDLSRFVEQMREIASGSQR